MGTNDLDSSRDELDRLQDEVSRLRRELSMRDAEFAACRGELEQARHDLTRSQEQQDATVDVLRAIATSPDDLQGILDTVVRQATELAIVQRIDGEYLPIVAWHARPGAEAAVAGMRELERTGYRGSPYRRTSISGTAFLERCTVHVPDTKLVAETFPDLYATSR